ncbi:MAG TPA: formate--tetrahydrofolate ligase [Acidimicrobiia bacterium]|nr:formate--tetrahydrofolate ligase [Acidimicrobiia bacterium]
MGMPTDLDISRAATPRPIEDVAGDLGLPLDSVQPWGPGVAKISLDAIERLGPPRARYVLVTATTPTPFGEGKTTVAVGLSQALNRLGLRSVVTLRQPSLGPTFGIKGGAAGGGYAQVIPMERLNLHLSGDFHAATAATNMLAALVDAHIHHGNTLDIDVNRITWRRVLDVNDRALRHIVLGLGGVGDGRPRQESFDITAAGEVMAILALSSGLPDLRERLSRVLVGYARGRRPITAGDLGATGAMTVLMLEALQPNLLQTIEGGAALVHAGPFANVAPGVSSVIADSLAVRAADFVVTEAGFGSEVGAEKFFNLKCRASGLAPDAAVIVTTIRGLKAQSGQHRIVSGKDLPSALLEDRPEEVEAGAANLRRHVEIVRLHGVEPVVAVNVFPGDHPAELRAVGEICDALGVRHALTRAHAEGGSGCLDLAEAVALAASEPTEFTHLYPLDLGLREKIELIATRVYGADGVAFDKAAQTDLKHAEDDGFGHLGVCVAKTPLSISHDPSLRGDPRGWVLPVRRVRVSAGAGFVVPLAGDISTMPGLGSKPAALDIDVDPTGRIVGLS